MKDVDLQRFFEAEAALMVAEPEKKEITAADILIEWIKTRQDSWDKNKKGGRNNG